jgi:hypothetical protein
LPTYEGDAPELDVVSAAATAKGFAQTQQGMVLLGKSIEGVGITIFSGFKPAVDGVVQALTDLAQWFRKAIEEGGGLHDLFVSLTNTANVLSASLSSVVHTRRAGGANPFPT